MNAFRRVGGSVLLTVYLAGCASGPAVPHWQADAHDAQQLAIGAELEGNQRVAQVEWQRAHEAVARTARPEVVARMALSRCAVRQAGLDLTPCEAFQALAVDAAPPEQAYQRYLEGRGTATDVNLLPETHRALAQALLQPGGAGAAGTWTERLRQQADPLARLVGASVLLRTGHADAEVMQLAVDTASEQGWRRPLLAWLTLQADTLRQAGQTARAEAIERRRRLLLP